MYLVRLHNESKILDLEGWASFMLETLYTIGHLNKVTKRCLNANSRADK